LIDYLGGEKIAGAKMKSKENMNGTNSSGFSALPIGTRYENGEYFHICAYWSADIQGLNFEPGGVPFFFGCEIHPSLGSIYFDIYDINYGLSIRCLKD
jgi:uncharacterized protein (TIGR02145 family)